MSVDILKRKEARQSKYKEMGTAINNLKIESLSNCFMQSHFISS